MDAEATEDPTDDVITGNTERKTTRWLNGKTETKITEMRQKDDVFQLI